MKKNEKGFTLVELMIVVAIIAILAAVALPAFGSQIKKSKDGKAVQMLGSMRSQLGMVQADLEGAAPTTTSAINVFNGGTVAGLDGSSVDSKGIQGFNKIATASNINCGTAGTTTKVNWNYESTNVRVQFNELDTVKDTKGKAWSAY